MTSTYQALVQILTEKFSVPQERISIDTTLNDLGLDSLATLEFFDTIQEDFGAPVDDAEISGDFNLAAAVTLIQSALSEQAQSS